MSSFCVSFEDDSLKQRMEIRIKTKLANPDLHGIMHNHHSALKSTESFTEFSTRLKKWQATQKTQ